MDVLMFSPGYPAEMPYFTRGLAEVGARVWGLGDQPAGALPDEARRALAGYLQVPDLWDERRLLDDLRRWRGPRGFDRVECLWEPGMLLAARLREALGAAGMSEAETVPFRDKGRMKEVLDAAGLRTPRHFRAKTADSVREAAERVGYPVCVKPIAGAGSADTYKVSAPAELEGVLQATRHVPEVSVEEWIEGEEYTFDTICADGRILYHNIAWYRPKPIVGRSVEWISPQTVTLRDVDHPDLQSGVKLGLQVLQALGFRTGFTHMEWFRKPDGEAVFGEIAARPPGARSTELMNYGCDIDVFRGWAEAVVHGSWSQPLERKYNSAVIF
ncbi:MAG TPA: ATP-grasp domain-containing protein, partial [Thermoanaerobaculia bacterium]|nr:ATP-grasp domain-containing protein [Thermoanaerobaculia bacterium]